MPNVIEDVVLPGPGDHIMRLPIHASIMEIGPNAQGKACVMVGHDPAEKTHVTHQLRVCVSREFIPGEPFGYVGSYIWQSPTSQKTATCHLFMTPGIPDAGQEIKPKLVSKEVGRGPKEPNDTEPRGHGVGGRTELVIATAGTASSQVPGG